MATYIGQTTQGALTAATGAASTVIAGCTGTSTGAVQITGTFVGTVQFEGTVDGATWVSVTSTPVPSGATVTSATAPGVWQFTSGGLNQFRARCSAYTSGTATVTISFGP